jgi:hypothetical protein
MSSVAASLAQLPVRAKYFKAVPKMTVVAAAFVADVSGGDVDVNVGGMVKDVLGPAVYTIDSPISATMTETQFTEAVTASDAAAQRLAVNAMYINKGKTVTVRDASANVTAVYALVRPVVNGDAVTGDPGTALAVADLLVQIFDLADPSNVRVVAA